MSYLLDKKNKRILLLKYFISIVLFIFIYFFRSPVWNGLSYITQKIFSPVVYLGNGIGNSIYTMRSYFMFKSSLLRENENLKLKLNEQSAQLADHRLISEENLKLNEILNRKDNRELIISNILEKPNRSPYDTLIIDIGQDTGARYGKKVFAYGNIPIGYIAVVYPDTAKVVLYSSPGEKTEVIVPKKSKINLELSGDVFLQAVGRGGGNFELILPRDFILEEGTEISLPGNSTNLLGIVRTTISDPRDSYQKALLTSPVNVQELKFVGVEK